MSSAGRDYIPIAIVPSDVVATNKIIMVPGADLYWFGLLQSAMHMAWTRAAGGRLKSDYQYSPGMVYNTFPFPQGVSTAARSKVETAATAVLAARAGQALATIYDPDLMPPALRKAHNSLDAAVDALYARKKFIGDIDRTVVLFEHYTRHVNGLFADTKPKRVRTPSLTRTAYTSGDGADH